jgi:hypothetical protein
VTRKLRAAEVALDPPSVRERPGRVRGEEAPYIEVLDAVLTVHVMLRRTLAECDAEQPVAVAPPRRRFAIDQASKVEESELAEPGEVSVGDPLARALSPHD